MPPSKFYRFQEQRYWRGSLPVVGFVSAEIVHSFCTIAEMTTMFGGYLEYEDTGGSQRYLGVWGERKVGRFLKLLRERGATLEIEHPSPSGFRQRHRLQGGG